MKTIFTKKFAATILIGVSLSMFAAACGHGTDGASGTTTTSAGPIVVTTTPSTNTTPAPSTSTTFRRTSEAPTAPQVDLTTRYVLTAKPRPLNSDNRVAKKRIQVYATPNGDLIPTETVTGANGKRCRFLRDYSIDDNCQPTDPTFWGQRLTFLVTDGAFGAEWAEVLLSTRPNNTRGWVRTEDFTWTEHNFHIIVDLSENSVSVWEGKSPALGQAEDRTLVAHTLAILGKKSTQTPVIATTYIEAKIFNEKNGTGSRGPVVGSWIFPLAGFSTALETFGGLAPQIAIHGTNIPGRVGEDLSNGCVRIPNEVIEQIAAMIPLGTPVSIIA